MSVYKLAGAGTGGTENAIAQLDIQFDGLITAIHGDMRAALDADGEFGVMEASFISTNTIGNNDTRGSLYQLSVQETLTTSGGLNSSNTGAVGGLAIAVNAGERLWLHLVVSASTVCTATIYIYVEDGQGVPTAQRRR